LAVFFAGGIALRAQPALRPADADVSAAAMKILKENCFSCHNPEKKKGGLILTSRETALKGNEDGPVIVPGDSAHSTLAKALLPEADPHMPPKRQLEAGDFALLKKWIDAGAPWNQAALAQSAPTTRPVVLRTLPATYHPVMALALSPDQKRLAVGRGDRVLIFDVAAKERPLVKDLSSGDGPVYSLAWSGDGKHLARGGYRTIRVWDSASFGEGVELKGMPGRAASLAFTPDGGTLVAGGGEVGMDGMIAQWHMPDGTFIGVFPAHRDTVLSIKISGDGRWLATGGADKLAKLWDLPQRREVAKFEGHVAQVGVVAFNPDATLLASAGADKEVKVWNLASKDQVWSLMAHTAEVTDLAWLDAKHLASTCEDRNVRLLSEQSKERSDRLFTGASDVLYCLAMTRDGKTAYAGCHDGAVYVFSLANGKMEGKLTPNKRDDAAKK
jgi:WD40 repeat protein